MQVVYDYSELCRMEENQDFADEAFDLAQPLREDDKIPPAKHTDEDDEYDELLDHTWDVR
jgi:hypothetical protein